MIHSWRMIGPLHKRCHPKSLLVVTENGEAATYSPQAKRRPKVASLKAKEWWASSTTTSNNRLQIIDTSSPKVASAQQTKEPRDWPGPTIFPAWMASTRMQMQSTITLSMEPLTKLPKEWRRWRNLRSCSTKECHRRNKEVSQLVLKYWMESRRTTMPATCAQHRGHKQAKQS